ncbi:hypothetical protein M434DRAFT_393967 [Hypoxylon sp. CO27-5]|nr:hypothetical protein M434DRAFT_393967 [Hypoxylon sp. CO27-5]
MKVFRIPATVDMVDEASVMIRKYPSLAQDKSAEKRCKALLGYLVGFLVDMVTFPSVPIYSRSITCQFYIYFSPDYVLGIVPHSSRPSPEGCFSGITQRDAS